LQLGDSLNKALYIPLAWTIHETPNSFTEPFSRSEFCFGKGAVFAQDVLFFQRVSILSMIALPLIVAITRAVPLQSRLVSTSMLKNFRVFRVLVSVE